uniref:BTB/POZ and MATH domain-containing protein 3-like n=1 Tax=Nicotiana tabacum TaxID=4097 RepID=A0A1S3XGE0_TOBAC|nr:PREDICTED: BTB/POZ and MATH domain-containing protein 3-like [Nicotiana tabacum]
MADFCNEDGVSRSISETPPTHYTLKIQSLSLLKKNNIEKYTSPYFEAGGYKWKLVFHPTGNKNKNAEGKHVSIYLMMAEASSLVHAVFRLFLLDQNNDNYLVLQGHCSYISLVSFFLSP